MLFKPLADTDDCAFVRVWRRGGAPFQNFALAFRERGIGVVIMTNGAYGESVFADLVTLAIGGSYPVFPWDRFVATYFSSAGEGHL